LGQQDKQTATRPAAAANVVAAAGKNIAAAAGHNVAAITAAKVGNMFFWLLLFYYARIYW
jgi:hypothetical protein